jgi:hypothetical protein
MEGLVKDFYLSYYCQRNLQLIHHIIYQTITFQEWEVTTPETEKSPADKNKPDLFSMPKLIKEEALQGAKSFY